MPLAFETISIQRLKDSSKSTGGLCEESVNNLMLHTHGVLLHPASPLHFLRPDMGKIGREANEPEQGAQPRKIAQRQSVVRC